MPKNVCGRMIIERVIEIIKCKLQMSKVVPEIEGVVWMICLL
jgi:hypothetical protein